MASLAPDILPTPLSSQRRYAAYVRARARFWEAFPGGYYTRLATPGTDLECGFYALILSMREQYSLTGSDSTTATAMRIPTLAELREVFWSSAVGRECESVGMENGNWFTADQLAAVFAEWGRRFLNPEGESGSGSARGNGRVRCQMGWVTDADAEVGEHGWPVMMNTPEVDTGEVGEGIVRVWVWNDGGSLRGGVGHFEGIRRPTSEEVELIEGAVGSGDRARVKEA